MRTVIIGLGGIGSNIVEPLSRILTFSQSKRAPKRLILIDGDKYEERNRERQKFQVTANKAESVKDWLRPLFSELDIEAKPRFVDESNAFVFIKEGDAVFLSVDNHATRKLVSDHAATLSDILVISGGNELYDGNVQIYERRKGIDITTPLVWLHPEIESPQDRNPAELNCQELAKAGSPQLLAVNFMVASLMLNAFCLWLEERAWVYNEIYFDILTGNCRPSKIDRK
ncbi:MAG: ThiF family adenylyltransferase [Candidatus Azambacteria bacterium]|nr:ThiF family adenylyltransferase [Candidatus Azambacteria bacterium]